MLNYIGKFKILPSINTKKKPVLLTYFYFYGLFYRILLNFF